MVILLSRYATRTTLIFFFLQENIVDSSSLLFTASIYFVMPLRRGAWCQQRKISSPNHTKLELQM